MTLTAVAYRATRRLGAVHVLRLSWHEARPVVQLVFLLRFVTGAALGRAENVVVPVGPLALAATSWLAATWAIYLLNGVADIVEDRANGSTRPIARGALPRRAAAVLVGLLAAAALGLGAFVSGVHVLLVVLLLAVGWAYSMGPRPLKANQAGFVLAVFALGALTYLAGWCAVGTRMPGGSLVLFGMAMSTWMGLGGSTKDLSDVEGDRLAGRRTLPLLLGERRARVVNALTAAAVGWSFVACCVLFSSRLLPAAMVVCAGSAVLAAVALTSLGDGDRHRKRRPYRAFMVTQYLAHLTMLVLLVDAAV
jgi:4-hydroxybenzoate polyprenyltransferase